MEISARYESTLSSRLGKVALSSRKLFRNLGSGLATMVKRLGSASMKIWVEWNSADYDGKLFVT